MRYLIAFGLLVLGALAGILIISILTKSKFADLSETAEFQKARADELADKLEKLQGGKGIQILLI